MLNINCLGCLALGILCLNVGTPVQAEESPGTRFSPSSLTTGGWTSEKLSAPAAALRAAPRAAQPAQPMVLPFVQGHSAVRNGGCNCVSEHHMCCGHQGFKAKMQCQYWGYPEEFCERPFGTLVRAQLDAQIANGLVSQLALYQYDFHDPPGEQAAELTPRGRVQLEKIAGIAQILPFTDFHVVIEATGDAELDDARRKHVLEELAEYAVPVTEDQILAGRSRAAGVSGVEAFEVYLNQLKQTRAMGGSLGNYGSSSLGNGGGEILAPVNGTGTSR